MEAPLVAPGRVLAGRYRLGSLLGRGGMADVFDAVDLRLDRPVAVKVMRGGSLSSEDLRARFESEAIIAARLEHPNVVAVYDTGDDDGLPFIVLERLSGETLAHRIARGPVPWPELRPIAMDVLAALGAAHAAGVVHRDIKPGNVLFDEHQRVKVADFGIARESDALGGPVSADPTTATTLTGTPAYLSPERVEGEPATPRGDLYALGVVLYEALSGQKPFNGDSPLSTAFAVLHHDAPPLRQLAPGTPPPVAAAIDRVMARAPDDRFADAAEMAAALGLASAADEDDAATLVAAPVDDTLALAAPAAAAGAAVPAAMAGPGRPRRVSPRALLAMAATAVVALVLVGVALASGDSAPEPATESVTSTTVPVTRSRVVAPPPTTVPPTTTLLETTTVPQVIIELDEGKDEEKDKDKGRAEGQQDGDGLGGEQDPGVIEGDEGD